MTGRKEGKKGGKRKSDLRDEGVTDLVKERGKTVRSEEVKEGI